MLWDERRGKQPLEQLKGAEATRVDATKGPVVFDGKSAHAVEPFSGQRWSAVFYSCCADYDLCEGVQQAAENLGLRVPDARALERMKAKLEAQPQGHSTGSADAAAAGRRAGGVEN